MHGSSETRHERAFDDRRKRSARSLTRRHASQAVDDAAKRSSLEKKLQELQEEAEERRRRSRTKKIDARYKRIKFYERKKLERRRKRIERERTERPRDAELLQRMNQVLEDLRYVRHFPSGEKYVSVLVEGDEHVRRKREELRRIIREKRGEETREPSEGLESERDLERTPSDGNASTRSGEEEDEDDWDDANPTEMTSNPSKDASEEAEEDDFFLPEVEQGAEPNRSTEDKADAVVAPSSESDGSKGIRRGGLGHATKQQPAHGRFHARNTRDAKGPLPYQAKGPANNFPPAQKRKVMDPKPTGTQQHAKPNLPRRTGNRPAPNANGTAGSKGKKKEADRPGKKMPLRTRAEGGRKRRKKKL